WVHYKHSNQHLILKSLFLHKKVIKPTVPVNMKHIVPAVKARGRPYLHLIYGFDYDHQKDIFSMLVKRDLSKKWAASKKQHRIAYRLLESFLHGKRIEQMK